MPLIQPFTRCRHGDVSSHVLLTWVEEVFENASDLINVENVVEGRGGFKTITGSYRGIRLSVVKTPIGAHGTLIAVEELSKLGARVFVKVGLGYALSPSLKIGDVVVATSAIKGDGVSKATAPLEAPAIPSYELLELLIETIRTNVPQTTAPNRISFVQGLVWSSDLYYSNGPAILESDSNYKQYARLVLVVDSDTAALYTIGLVKKLQTISMDVVEASKVKGLARGELFSEDTEHAELRRKLLDGIESATKLAIEALSLHYEHSMQNSIRRGHS